MFGRRIGRPRPLGVPPIALVDEGAEFHRIDRAPVWRRRRVIDRSLPGANGSASLRNVFSLPLVNALP